MGRFSILSRKARVEPDVLPVLTPEPDATPAAEIPKEAIRFPGNDGGKSLAEMAERDLESALQLLAERAQYITGASGAAIALRDVAGEMVCRASAGPSAPELGAHLQINSGLSGESIRTRQILRCDNAETDERVNRESCRALGIASVVVLPLQRDEEVNGVFELFSSRANAFEERDIVALQRLAEMIQVAMEHSEAAKRAEQDLATQEKAAVVEETAEVPVAVAVEDKVVLEPEAVEEKKDSPVTATAPSINLTAEVSPATEKKPATEVPQAASALKVDEISVVLPAEPPLAARGNIGKCASCGFPVSEGRTLCLDCEAHQSAEGDSTSGGFLSEYQAEESWISSHKYLIGIVIVVLATVVVLLRFR